MQWEYLAFAVLAIGLVVLYHHLDATQLVRKASYWKRKINMLKQFEELSLEQYE
ncbi:hypothetical protein L0U88_12740 [Flavihumibacter sp. RY-1]|uniref:Uncharacterized protein n=1 Tax=Flavihumibacter fluminis TaxID=2909236 RepID=A0ABS9BLI5_9BACT|nr:hypothetical protein [Flavihumibacter fluminis]MCF1715496.1 hypothetical protein [Flavihumibacter fluminis]